MNRSIRKMLRRTNAYIYNLKEAKPEDLELIGLQTYNMAQVYKEPVNYPVVVAITSIAFDDFLIASNAAGPIMNVLSRVRPFDYNSALDASGQIANIILTSKIPDIVVQSIIDAYHIVLESSRSPYIELGISEVVKPEFKPDNDDSFSPVEIVNEQHLIEQVKYAWLSLFSVRAIEKRANTYYKDALSIALYLKSIVRSELSGKIFSVPPVTNEDNMLEIWGIYGGMSTLPQSETVADSYKFDIKKKTIVQKNIIPQEVMHVRKGKPVLGESPIIEVKISKEWSRKQKLTDQQISQIADIALFLEKKLAKPLEISWSSEGGELFVTEVNDLFIPSLKENPAIEDEKEFLEQYNVNVYKDENSISTKLGDPDLDKIEEEISNMVNNGGTGAYAIKEFDDKGVELVSAKSKRKNIEYPAWMALYDLQTKIYLDVSALDIVSLSALDLFDGSFYDGTELVLANDVLPETYKLNKTKLQSTVERFASDIAIASKDSEGEPLIYSFSNISDYEYKLLGYEKKNYGFMSDERFIEHPEALAVEVLAIKKAKEDYDRKKISVVFPYVRTINNLEALKTIVSSQGLRRSKLTKFYAEVAIPSFVYEMETIPEGIVDGFIINYDALLKLMVYREEVRKVDHEVVIRLVRKIVDICKKLGYEFIFKITEQYIEVVEAMVEMSPESIIFAQIPAEEMIKTIQRKEKTIVKPKTRENSGLDLHTKLTRS